MIIEIKNISDLKPAPYNPRISTKKQEDNLRSSLEKYGVVEPIIFNKQTGYIVGGHFRVRELKKLGYKEVECVIVELSPEDEKELNIRLNANTGEWYWESLANEWDGEELEKWGLDVPEFGEIEDVDYSDKNKEFDANDFEDQKYTIKLEFTEDDYNLVKDKLQELGQSPEKILYDALVSL
jgi:ParB-like chromosome segregation protein Spo0J